MWLVGICAKATFPVCLVIGVIAFKPDCLTVTLKCKDMRGNAVKEPAVVRDHHRAAGKIQQCFFQCAQGFHVKVIGGFVQQQDITAALQEFCQVHPVAFATRETADMFLLITPGKIET